MESKHNFKTFYQSLPKIQRVAFAKAAGTDPDYIKTHLVYARKIPQPKLMDGLVSALNEFESDITRQDLLNFFYPPTKSDKRVGQ
jgi:hypothetical protein